MAGMFLDWKINSTSGISYGAGPLAGSSGYVYLIRPSSGKEYKCAYTGNGLGVGPLPASFSFSRKDFESWGDTLYITLRTPVTQKQDIENVLREFVIYLGGFGLSDEQIENLERFLRERLHPYTRTRS